MLPNPVSGGNYTCRIDPDSPAASCLPKDDPALERATVHVDEVTERLSLIEAQQGALTAENAHLKDENARLSEKLNALNASMNGSQLSAVHMPEEDPLDHTCFKIEKSHCPAEIEFKAKNAIYKNNYNYNNYNYNNTNYYYNHDHYYYYFCYNNNNNNNYYYYYYYYYYHHHHSFTNF
nr:hypothetical protein BaRGS_011711 [Batillaria attramentaria]